ncbi:MAG: putative DNA binding domain-containing protein [Christensenellaceae bacterium]|nr:putative DNA binding domain-containing protein [Christensenellaceae bacterium]
MSFPINIDDLIRGQVVENSRVEYRREWNPEPILHTICAFANDIDNIGGGYIIIGVEEENGMPKFPVIGLQQTEFNTINKELLEICNLMEPIYIPIVEKTLFDGVEICVIWIPGGHNKPYKCPITLSTKDKKNKQPYIRKMSKTIRADAYAQHVLLELSNNIPFDDRPNLSATLADLNRSFITDFLYRTESKFYEASKVMSTDWLATNLHISHKTSESMLPLNVALLFFNDRQDKFFPCSWIEIVNKPDHTGNLVLKKTFYGPLDKQLTYALDYIRCYILAEKIVKFPNKAESIQLFNYPYPAIVELLGNAVYHKAYDIEEPIIVLITPENITITSTPGPDPTISDTDIKQYNLIPPSYRNRRIGDFLKKLNLVVGRYTGIPRAIKALINNGSDLPLFETDARRSYFKVAIPIHHAFLSK